MKEIQAFHRAEGKAQRKFLDVRQTMQSLGKGLPQHRPPSEGTETYQLHMTNELI